MTNEIPECRPPRRTFHNNHCVSLWTDWDYALARLFLEMLKRALLEGSEQIRRVNAIRGAVWLFAPLTHLHPTSMLTILSWVLWPLLPDGKYSQLLSSRKYVCIAREWFFGVYKTVRANRRKVEFFELKFHYFLFHHSNFSRDI